MATFDYLAIPTLGLSLLGVASVEACAQPATSGDLHVTLLGTGAPPPDRARMGPSVLIEAAGQRLLFDVGRGASTSLRAHGRKVGDVRRVFLTHLHADHVVGLPDLWLTGHHRDTFGQRSGPMTVHGPAGVAQMLEGLGQAYAGVAERWGLAAEDIRPIPREFQGEGVVFDSGGVRVAAFRVVHGEDAYGYRIDHGDRSVVLSGDTGYSENLIAHAEGADLLIHEVFFVGEDSGMDPALRARLRRIHTQPERAVEVFSRAAPRLAVATHLGPDYTGEIEARVRAGYGGRFVMGQDMMTVVVGDSVRVTRGVRAIAPVLRR